MKGFFARKTQERKLLGRVDILLIVFILLICASFYLPFLLKKDEVKANIIYNGEIVEQINLSKNGEDFTLKVGRCEIGVEKNEIFFLNSPCPDKVCVKTGRLSRSGEFASCVPEKVTIILEGGAKLPDAVTY
ncbi:MAG: NusG domain II-containing protein [Clostridia bacterium]|nr:NusG domain II-containing protein [Clostridia bacterium]